jgi:hypothetical protein
VLVDRGQAVARQIACSSGSSQAPVARRETPRRPVRRSSPRDDQQPGAEHGGGVWALGVLEERRVDRAGAVVEE